MFYSPGQKPRAKPRNIVGSVLNSMLAVMPANTFKANITGGQAAPTDVTRAALRFSIFYPAQVTVITATGAGTYTTPTVNGELPLYIRVRMVGAGGGAGGNGTGGGNGTAGGNTTFNAGAFTANGGANGVNNPTDGAFPAGGTASGGSINLTGQDGGSALNGAAASSFGPEGGASFFAGAGQLLIHSSTAADAANAAKANTGSGGGCGGTSAAVVQANAGAAGGYCEGIITSPAASYSYSNGAKGTGGSAGTSGSAGGNGGDGIIIIEAYWQ
jgi:hypothetical protein